MNKFLLLITTLTASLALANGEIASPNMGMPIPTVGVTTGPIYATDINMSLGILDSHNHTPGNGVAIPPAGLNINSDLSFQGNNLTSARALRMTPQSAAITSASPDIGQLYNVLGDLYYNDSAGHQIRITQSGSVTGASGTISGLPSGAASAAYLSGSGTFQFLQATSTAANIDSATYVLRYPGSYPTPTGNYIALQAPTALATGFALTLPATLPGTLGMWMTSDTSGNLSWSGVDNSTLQYSSNVVSVKNSGISTAQIADGSVTRPKLAALPLISSSSCGTFSTNSLSPTFVPATNLNLSITTSGRPVMVMLQPDGNASLVSSMFISTNVSTSSLQLKIFRGSTLIGYYEARNPITGTMEIPVSSISFIDFNSAAGTNNYSVFMATTVNGSPVGISNAVLVAYEL